MADGKNIFDPLALMRELADVRRQITLVRRVLNGRGAYPRPVPDLRQLQRREFELVGRIENLNAAVR